MTANNQYPAHPILIVDDEEALVSGYKLALTRAGIGHLLAFTDSRKALEVVKSTALDMVLLDLNMPFVSGEDLLTETVTRQPGVPIVVISGNDTIESAVFCTKQGACDYLVKPVSAERIVTTVRNALKIYDLQNETRALGNRLLGRDLKHPEHFAHIITTDPMMQAIFIYIEAIAPTSNPILITGETGVGKELLAQAIHRASGRPGPFVAVNIAGLDDTMFSDTLFGHKKGAFTSAESARPGLIAQATGGTLFLDEIGELNAASQVKLLRLLQEQEYMPLGQDHPIKTDARIIVATNADLASLQSQGKFRPDLFYRLSTHKIHLPPLRNRRSDLDPLTHHFLAKIAGKLNRKTPTIPRELGTLLASYDFPGNIRELEAMLTDAVSRHGKHILSLHTFQEHIGGKTESPAGIMAGQPHDSNVNTQGFFGKNLPPLKDAKRLLAEEAMRRANGNRTQAARLLKTSRQALSWYVN